uniref:Phosphatidylinositol 3,5-kinase n=4 Tax=Oryza TaxID=4527 RepID=Q69MW6_ORYSJ|nr:putative phosphatidylinositol 3,5-kinase [Oryza sativa Japonica Group]
MDERFIIKQVTKTELDSFIGFAPHYFRHLAESLTSRSPTCLAKIMGLYQVNIKGLKGGREVKMDLMVMENIFFQRTISRVYDLKGSVRSRYNSDTSGHNKVLLDSNLIEAQHTNPIFLGSKAKQRMERAVWNDTSFLASLDVMDYSLLVGVDERKNELVIGIIDFLRQYTWDKQLETWVKASGILGGSKNEAPTVISPVQYKKRFRKAMSRYFLAVPDDWSSS